MIFEQTSKDPLVNLVPSAGEGFSLVTHLLASDNFGRDFIDDDGDKGSGEDILAFMQSSFDRKGSAPVVTCDHQGFEYFSSFYPFIALGGRRVLLEDPDCQDPEYFSSSYSSVEDSFRCQGVPFVATLFGDDRLCFFDAGGKPAKESAVAIK